MNICILFFSYGVWGGAETLTYELARHLRDKGENVSIILNEEVQRHYTDLENVRILSIGPLYPPKSAIPHPSTARRRRSTFARLISVPFNYLDEMLRCQRLRSLRKDVLGFMMDNRVEVVNALLEGAVPFASDLSKDLARLGIPTVIVVTGEPHLRGTQPVGILSRPTMRWTARRFREALRKCRRVIGPSAFILDAWEDQGVPLRAKSSVIPTGVDVSEIQRTSQSPSGLKGEFNLLFPGGARFIKGGDLILKAMPEVIAQVPSTHLYIASDVPQDHLLRCMVVNLQLRQNVTFAGQLQPQDFRRLLASVDILVMPSRGDAGPTVYVEAMALGKPIVAANAGATPEMVKHMRNGILVPLDPHQISGAILHLYHNVSLRKQMGENNLQDVMRFDWDRIVDQYIQIYRDVSK